MKIRPIVQLRSFRRFFCVLGKGKGSSASWPSTKQVTFSLSEAFLLQPGRPMHLPVLTLIALMLLGSSTNGAGATVQTNGFRLIDLSELRTASAALGRPLAAVPSGLRTFHAVPFRVDSAIGVTGIE